MYVLYRTYDIKLSHLEWLGQGTPQVRAEVMRIFSQHLGRRIRPCTHRRARFAEACANGLDAGRQGQLVWFRPVKGTI